MLCVCALINKYKYANSEFLFQEELFFPGSLFVLSPLQCIKYINIYIYIYYMHIDSPVFNFKLDGVPLKYIIIFRPMIARAQCYDFQT
jgi:hypothetical protein